MQDTLNRPTQLEAVRGIMLAATEPMSLKAIAQATAVMTGKPASEAAVSARIRDLRKPKFGGLRVLRERCNDGSYTYQAVIPRANDEVGTPEGTVKADTLPRFDNLSPEDKAKVVVGGIVAEEAPRNPISYGRPKSNVSPALDNMQPVAGSRSAMAFADTLKQ